MGICQIKQKYEFHGITSKNIPIDLSVKVSKSICKITFIINNESNKGEGKGTGFFMNAFSNNIFRCLITNNHVISKEFLGKSIKLELHNKQKIDLLLDKNIRFIKFFEGPDISVIQIKEDDFDIIDNVDFMDYDINYSTGYKQYQNIDVFTLGYPLGKIIVAGTGKIYKEYKVKNFNEFEHNVPTNRGSSGSPIISLESLKIVGVHKIGDTIQNINVGVFIGYIIENLKADPDINQFLNNENNCIIAKIVVKEKDLNKKIPIICSYEEYEYKYNHNYFKLDPNCCNEEQIINCDIFIDNKKIPFSYSYKFNKAGEHIIKYLFKNVLTNTNSMFSKCSCITNINLSNFDTKNVYNMGSMFSECSSLSNLNLSNFITKNVYDTGFMFFECSSLLNLNLSNFDTKNVHDMNSMFSGCSSLVNLNLSNFNTKNVRDMGCMFSKCSSLSSLNLSNFDTSNVIFMDSMFSSCSSLSNLNLFSFDTQSVTDMKFMFSFCPSLLHINLYNFDTKNVTNMSHMFCYCSSLQNLNISNFDTKNVTDMSSMFSFCYSLSNLNLSNFDTGNVTKMSNMLSYCSSLPNINLSNFDTRNVTEMDGMFSSCSCLSNLNLSNFDTKNVTNMSDMFSYCSFLSDLDLSNFNTGNVTDMSSMFSSCSSLSSLNLSSFETKNVTNMSEMFSYCSSLGVENLITNDAKIINELKNKKISLQ